MKPSAFLINTSRGPVCDQLAVAAALAAGQIAGAAIDVFDPEPSPVDHPIFAVDNFIGTPHNLCQTDQMQDDIAAEIIRAVRAVMAGETPADNFMVNGDEIVQSELWRAKLAAVKAKATASARL